MREKRKSGIMWKWFFSYTAVLILSVIFGVVIYLFSVGIITRQTEELQSENAEKDYTYLEQTLEEIGNNAQNILLSEDVNYFSGRRIHNKQEEAMLIKKVQDFLHGFCMANKAIDEISLFYPGQGLILTNENCQSMTQNTLLRNGMFLYGEPFNRILSEKPYNRLFMMQNNQKEYLVYTLCTDGRKSFVEQDLVVMIAINQNMLVRQFQGDESSALLLTVWPEEEAHEPILLELGNQKLAQEAYRHMETEAEKDAWADRKIYIRRQDMDQYKLTMWNVYSNQKMHEQFRVIWLILIIYVACSLLVGTYVIYRISKKNYTPVENLIRLMESHGLITGERDEFTAIHSNLLSLLKGVRDNQKRWKQQQDFYEESDLYYLLCTDRAQRNVTGEMERAFAHRGFLVVSFDAEDVREELRAEESEESIELLDFVIANVVREFYADFEDKISGKLNGLYYVILNFPMEEQAENAYQIRERAQNICRFLREQFDFALCANISRCTETKERLQDAYKELQEISEFRNYIGSEEIILCYDGFSDDEEIRREMNYFTLVKQLSELLRAHRHEEAEKLQEMIRKNWQMTEWSREKEEKLEKNEEKVGKRAEQTIERVEAFLQEHYLDPQLTVSFVADLFGLNASYLSRSFCRVTGKGMLEYLTDLRLKHAKKCMEEGESVNGAAEHSGFYTCRPLIRAFKEEMGVTPGEYYKKKKKNN